MLKITCCPTCGSRKLKAVCRDLHREFEGHRYTVTKVGFHECPDCGERLYDRDAMRKIEAHSPAYGNAHASRC